MPLRSTRSLPVARSARPRSPIRMGLLAAIGLAQLILLNQASGDHSRALAQEAPGQKQPATAASQQEPQAPCPFSFVDVGSGDYFYNAVGYMFCRGVVEGYSDDTFRPYNATTRGQLSKMVVLAEAFPIDTSGGPHFSDVPPGSAFYSYVETAYHRSIISGYSDGSFRPNTNVGRGQLAKMLITAQGWPLANPSSARFSDAPVGSAYFKYVETAVSRNVMSGYGDGTFRVGAPATRGQIAKVLYLTTFGTQLTALEQATVDMINSRRAAMGLGGLRLNPSLTVASREHSNDIGPAGVCQHNGTDGSSPWDRIAQAGYTGDAMGEVVGCGYNSAQGVVDAWWASSGHYAILTDPNANSIGCGWWVNSTGYGWQTCDTGNGP
ncbi:MAG: S-layer homology domain-containing protein [Chloroflexia bacterium]